MTPHHLPVADVVKLFPFLLGFDAFFKFLDCLKKSNEMLKHGEKFQTCIV